MTVRDAVRRLHRWGGLSAGVLVAIVSLTGAWLLISLPDRAQDMDEAARVTPGRGARLPPSRLIAAGEAAFRGHTLRAAEFYADPSHAAVMHFVGGARVFVNPWTGEPFGMEEDASSRLERLHTTLFLNRPGEAIVDLVASVLVVLAALGVVLWWPVKRSVRRALTIELRRGWRRANYDVHNVLGFYAATLLLILGGTGMLMAYPVLQTAAGRAVERVFGDDHPTASDSREEASLQSAAPVSAAPTPAARVDRAIANAQRLFPDAPWVRTFPTRADSPSLRILVAADPSGNGERAHTLRADAAGDIRSLTRFGQERRVVRLRRLVRELHTGEGMGPVYRAGVFLACLIGGFLPLSGTLIWFPRWRRRRRRRHRGG